jgi:ABC-type transport system substrate-binding protein
VDNVPNAMNPFQYGINDNSDLLYRFLFRGLIKYNISTGIYQGDLTSCDISNLSKVTCTMRDDAVWSDGTRVKSEDIIATIEEFKNSATQEEMK